MYIHFAARDFLTRRLVALPITTALLLTACSSDAALKSDNTNTPQATEVSTNSSTTPQGDDQDRQYSQVSTALGWTGSEQSRLEQQVATEIDIANHREEHIAECMREAGFEYLALNQDFVATVIVDPDVPRDTPEWSAKYGFGLSTLMFPLEMVMPDGIGFRPEWLGAGPPGVESNPNAKYYAGLDEPGQQAYDITLNGKDGEDGCVAQAELDVPNPLLVVEASLASELEDLNSRIESSPDFFTLSSEVDACMQVEDFTFTNYASMTQTINTRLVDRGISIARPPEGEDVEHHAGDTIPGQVVPGSDEWLTRLIEIQHFEIELATEFDRCIGTDQWLTEVDRIAKPLREEFLTTNIGKIAPLIEL